MPLTARVHHPIGALAQHQPLAGLRVLVIKLQRDQCVCVGGGRISKVLSPPRPQNSQPLFLTSRTSLTPSASSAGAAESGFVTKACIRPQNLSLEEARPWTSSPPRSGGCVPAPPSLPAPRGCPAQPSHAPLAVPNAGEAELHVLSWWETVEEAAALVPLGSAAQRGRGSAKGQFVVLP